MATANVSKFRYDYKIHPLCAMFPDLPKDEFEKLKADIQAHGQLEPIMLSANYEVLLDGRHRLRACRELGIQPRVEAFTALVRAQAHAASGSPLTASATTEADYIWSKNIFRRHLSDDQRVALAAKWSDAEKEAAKERQRQNLKRGDTKPEVADSPPRGKTRKVIAQKAHASEHKVRQLESVAKSKPELLPKIQSGEMTLKDATKATRVRRKPKSVADTVAATIKNHPERVVDVDSQPEPDPVMAIVKPDVDSVDLEKDDEVYDGRARPRYTITLTVEGAKLAAVAKKASEAFGADLKTVEKEENPTSRQARLAYEMDKVENAKSEIEELKSELEQWKENMPDNLRDGIKAQELETAIEAISEVVDALGNAISESGNVDFPGM